MNWRALGSILIFAAGCSSAPSGYETETAPYKAAIVFEWPDDGSPAQGYSPSGAVAGGGPTPASAEPAERRLLRERIEDGILDGLDEYAVFSDYVIVPRGSPDRAAAERKADVIVLVSFGDVLTWERQKASIAPGMATLSSVLWITTGIGGWWIPDVDVPTRSQVDVQWKRAVPPEGADRAKTVPEFGFKETLTTGEYRLSFWDRAKLWHYPWAYLLSIVMPPPLVPIWNPPDVDRSLEPPGIKDLQFQMARRLQAAVIRSFGSPFLFQLRERRNGSSVQGDAVDLRFVYGVQPGFEDYRETGLSELVIELQPAGATSYRRIARYTGMNVMFPINERFAKGEPIEETLRGLKPGWNFVRFVARAALDGQWITNTVALESL